MRHPFIPVPILAVSLLLGVAVRPAAAVTVDELVNLKANGLGDDILVALVETDGSVFHLSAADIIAVKKLGLSDTVILAMIRTAQPPLPAVPDDVMPTPTITPAPVTSAAPASQPAFEPVVVPPAPAPVIVHVPVPVAVPVAIPVAVPVVIPVKAQEPAPVYWGWGGQRRPDSWVPASEVKPANPKSSDSKPSPKTP